MTRDPNSIAGQVDKWVDERPDSTAFTVLDVTEDLFRKNTLSRGVVRDRVSVKFNEMWKKGRLQRAGKQKGAKGRLLQLWVKVFEPDEPTLDVQSGALADEYPIDEPQVNSGQRPDEPVVTDWQMGRAVYNLIQHLESQIVQEQDISRRTQEQLKLRESAHRQEVGEMNKRIDDLKQEVKNLNHRLAQATTIRRQKQPIERTIPIHKLGMSVYR